MSKSFASVTEEFELRTSFDFRCQYLM